MPSDVTGVSVFDQRTNEFEFRPGPGLREPAARRRDQPRVAEDAVGAARVRCRRTRSRSTARPTTLSRPFMVIATQNPIEYEGTYPLPEAQLDRFAMRLTLGLPAARGRGPHADASRRASRRWTRSCRSPDRPSLLRAIEDAKARLRGGEPQPLRRRGAAPDARRRRVVLGASPRSGIALLRVAKARALAEGRDFLLPDDVKAVAPYVLAHRLIVGPEARAAAMSPRTSSPRRSRRRPSRCEQASPVLTRRGRLALLLGLGVYASAWAFGSRPLYPVAVGLVAAAVGARLWVATLSGPAVLRRLATGEHTEGEDVAVAVELALRRAGPAAGRHPRRSARDGSARSRSRFAAGAGACSPAATRCAGSPRGRYRFEPATAVLEDPFGLARVELTVEAPGALLVLPRIAHLDGLFSEAGAYAADGRRLLLRRPTGFDVHSVRDYERGESLRKVHWRATARRGSLMVKDLEDAPRDEVAVVLDARRDGRRDAAGFELRRPGARCGLDPPRAHAARSARRARRERRAAAARDLVGGGLAGRAGAARSGRAGSGVRCGGAPERPHRCARRRGRPRRRHVPPRRPARRSAAPSCRPPPGDVRGARGRDGFRSRCGARPVARPRSAPAPARGRPASRSRSSAAATTSAPCSAARSPREDGRCVGRSPSMFRRRSSSAPAG